ncbi:hypothetical protein GCM10011320_01460 [Neoroseomonas lacus]|uniref:Uncharacterized protein n=1 Tax=Neoroseomonas lacus TaxID=287609 RepID=A0A917NHH0_9PROT|nr:hypothetical protein GCM10011320_01460 [Neoroseomonas lacus]
MGADREGAAVLSRARRILFRAAATVAELSREPITRPTADQFALQNIWALRVVRRPFAT